MNRDDYPDIYDRIVAECFPEQSLFWVINRDSVISLLGSQNAPQPAEASPRAQDEFQFTGELVLGLQAASAVTGLTASLLAIYNCYVKSSNGTSEAKRLLLIDKLKNGGVAAEKIAKITEILASIAK